MSASLTDNPDASITPRDRLSFAFFVVVSLHVALILGIGFVWYPESQRSPTIEVTLAQHNDRQAPEEADFIAQSDQLGSGSKAEVKETTTTREAEFHDTVFRKVMAASVPPIEEQERVESHATLTTVTAAEEQAATQAPTPETTQATPPLSPNERYLELVEEVASLDARQAEQVQLDAKHPRVRRLTSVSAKRTVDAYYLQSWRRKVESVGNLNYPEEARSRQLYGSLRLLVAITPDGGLKEVRILDSSGHKVLDDAAVRIVKLAAPFAPFPEEMRQNTDVLEIIRTWQFRKDRYSSSA